MQQEKTQNRMLSVKRVARIAEVWPVQQRHVHSLWQTLITFSVDGSPLAGLSEVRECLLQ